MPMLVRATTTTNTQGRRRHLVLPSTHKSQELDADYLQALRVIDQTRRHPDALPLISKKRSDVIRQKRPKPFFQFSSTLTPLGQEAMVKTYEDTLISHVTNVYSSKRIGAVLPRLPTATFRHRLPMIKNTQQNLENIQQAQHLIDTILNNNLQKEEILGDYVRWQQNWTKNS